MTEQTHTMTLRQRADLALECLPNAPYREMLEKLFEDMLTQNSGEPINEQAAFEEWYTQRKRESFPKDYDESRFAGWAEHYRHDSLRGWNARAALDHPAPSTKPADVNAAALFKAQHKRIVELEDEVERIGKVNLHHFNGWGEADKRNNELLTRQKYTKAEHDTLRASFDELAAAVGWTKERGEQTGGSPMDVASDTLRTELEALRGQEPLPMDTAPTNGTMVRLLVDFEDNSLEDTDKPVWTVGACYASDSTGDVWQFAGWNWSHDCFTEGHGKPTGWLPMLAVPVAPAQPAQDVNAELVEALEVPTKQEGSP